MLISPDHRLVVSNLGWIDKSTLWTYDAAEDRESSILLGNANYLSLFACKDPGLFVVLHHYDGATVGFSVHSFQDPSLALCTLERTGPASSLQGDSSAFASAPRYYSAYFNPGGAGDYHLLYLDTDRGEICAERFAWYDGSYDKDYQGIVGVTELPSGNLIVSIQRDSHPLLYDPTTKQVLRKLSLANRAGNPTLQLGGRCREIWADDYDTLVKLDAHSLKIKGTRRLESGQFIGHWSLNEDESLCFVPRPFSGDVVAVSTHNLKPKYAATLGKQPLEAVSLNDSRVIARDWKTGELLKGSLRRAWFSE